MGTRVSGCKFNLHTDTTILGLGNFLKIVDDLLGQWANVGVMRLDMAFLMNRLQYLGIQRVTAIFGGQVFMVKDASHDYTLPILHEEVGGPCGIVLTQGDSGFVFTNLAVHKGIKCSKTWAADYDIRDAQHTPIQIIGTAELEAYARVWDQ